jgi:DNA-binding SARP family transcriptional activator
LWQRRVGVVVGPAGSGKTTLLGQFSESANVPVAWYRAEAGDGSAAAFVQAIGESLAGALGQPLPLHSLDKLMAAVDACLGRGALLVVDDLSSLAGTPAEGCVEHVVRAAPPGLRLLVASRRFPTFDLSRLRVSGDLVEVGPDDLRFRCWEVERLFQEFYREPMRPEDLAELARRTEGWAAGLQLFHLATRGKPVTERRRVLMELGSRSRMVREYLVRNVLDHLPDDKRDFLLQTCVLGRLTGRLCDEFLERSGSEATLRELESQQIFTMAVEEVGVYRYHEVLRAHLEDMLVEQLGEEHVRRRYRRAGRLLQKHGALAAALRAYCRAEDGNAAARLLGRGGEHLAADRGAWLDALPPGLLDQDPWLSLAQARRHLALGRLEAAEAVYQRAEGAFGAAPGGEVARRERLALALWLDPSAPRRGDWMGLLRAATQRDPLGAAREAAGLPGPSARFTEAVATLLAGRLAEGRRLLIDASELPGIGPILSVVAQLLAAGATLACARPPSDGVELLADEVEALDLPWMAELCRSVMEGSRAEDAQSPRVPGSWSVTGSDWTVAVAALLRGFAGLWKGEPVVELFEDAADRFRRLGAGVVETWARSGLALALAIDRRPEARDAAMAASSFARSSGLPAAEALSLTALGILDDERGDEYLSLAQRIAEESGIQWPLFPKVAGRKAEGSRPVPPAPSANGKGTMGRRSANGQPSVTLRCFGGFALELDGEAVDFNIVKPRPRAVLHLLALYAGRPAHRELMVEALWPDVDLRVGMRNLHVAMCSIRQLVEPGVRRGAWNLILREGDAYRLALPGDAAVDLLTFEAAVAEGRAARANGRIDVAGSALGRALDAYAGDLLPEEGPAEWVVNERERYRLDAVDAAQTLAEVLVQQGDPRATAGVCERGLRIDRYCDSLWRLLITAREAAGEQAAAARARRNYEDVLVQLGVDGLPR